MNLCLPGDLQNPNTMPLRCKTAVPAHLDPKLSWSIFSVDGPLSSTSSTLGTPTSLSNPHLAAEENYRNWEKVCQRLLETGPMQTPSIYVDQC